MEPLPLTCSFLEWQFLAGIAKTREMMVVSVHSVHMPGLESHHFQAALDGWNALKCTCADGISGLYHLGSSPPCFCGFVYVEGFELGV